MCIRDSVPTVPERVAALAALGYAARDGAEWKWDATPAPRRRLFAKIPVRPVAPRPDGAHVGVAS
nr:DUF6303 family protein [Streptomyces californicus]